MSFHLARHAWASGPTDCHASRRIVYVALADYALGDIAWPSLPALCHKTGFSLSTVKRSIRDLVKTRWIEKLRTGLGAGIRSNYRVFNKQQPESKEGGIKIIKGVTVTQKRGHGDRTPTPPYRRNCQLTVRGKDRASAEGPPPMDRTSASLGAPVRKLAKRGGRPHKPPQAPQPTLPLSEAPPAAPRASQRGKMGIVGEPVKAVSVPKDPRFDPIAKEIRTEYWRHATAGTPAEGSECPWGERENKELAALLEAIPSYSFATIQKMLVGRVDSIRLTAHLRSGRVSGVERPGRWLEVLPNFLGGPINSFGDPLPRGPRLV